MKLAYLLGNIFMVLLSLGTAFIACLLEYRWVTDASMTHTGVKYAGVAFVLVCIAFVGVAINELVNTIKGKE